MELSIVIPAYNEAQRLPATLKKIAAYLATQSRQWELIVVDDGSGDQTGQVATSGPLPVRVIRQERNLGKGAAVRTGMLAARGEWRLLCDADMSTPIEELDRLWAATDRADIVIGSRRASGAQVAKSQAWWKVWLGRGGNLLIQLLLLPGLKDTQCGFKLFNQRTSRIFEQQRHHRWGYDFELLFLARQAGWRIAEVPVIWYNDNQSKVKPTDYITTLAEIIQIRWQWWRGLYR